MSHVGYNKTTMLDLTCSVFAVFTATVLSVPVFSSYSSHFQSMASNSCQKTVNTIFEHIYVLHLVLCFLFFFFKHISLQSFLLQLPSMAMALYSSRQQSRPTITHSAFASEPPAPTACCFSPLARPTSSY